MHSIAAGAVAAVLLVIAPFYCQNYLHVHRCAHQMFVLLQLLFE
jgi:hypothetical protein